MMASDGRGQPGPGRWTVVCAADADEFGDCCFRARGSHGRDLYGEVKDPADIPLLLAGWQRPDDPPDPRTWEVELHALERGDHRLSDTDWTQPTLDEVHAQVYAATEQLAVIETRIAACRREWDGHTADEVIRKHADALEATAPQQPIVDPLVKLESSDVGRAVCFEWVDPRAIVSTVDPSWGAFNRRQESIWLMLHSLLTTSDLRRILVEEFLVPYLPDVVTLDRVPGPGGALYELGVCGSHRVHTARLLGLPWLLAQTVYHGPPTAARIYRHDVRGADPAASLPGLWAGLQARDLLDGDVERVSPWYTNLTVRHVAAAWLLNRPTRACTINRIYNTVHPGELERAGIPTDVATDPTAWHAWLEHAPSRPADGEPAHGPVRSRARLQRWLTELPGRMLAAGSLLLVGLLVRSALHAVAPRLDGSGGSAVGLATAAWWVALLLAGMTICGPVAAALALSLNEMAAVRWPDRHQRLREYWEAIASLLTPPAIPGQSAAPLAPSDTMLRVSDDGVWKTVHADLRDVRSPLGPVSAGMLRYRLWDFGAGHVEGEIGKCEEYPPRTGAAMLLLAELHRRHPDVRQWWISPLTRHPATRWRQAAAAHGFAYSPHTLLERRRELGIPYLSVMVWGAGDEHIVLDPDLAEADLELHADQAAYRTLAAQLTPDWAAEHARGASTWLHVYRVWDFDRFTDTARWAYGRAAGMHVLSQADSAGNRPS